jgi:hypothetical protein
VAALDCHRAHLGGGQQVARGHTYGAEHAADTASASNDVGSAPQITDDNVGATGPKLLRAFVIAADHRPHRLTGIEQQRRRFG